MPQDDHMGVVDTPMSQRLTNDDFRKLLMTPRSTPSGSGSSHPAGSVREAIANASMMAPPESEDKGELRRKKKSYYAALKKQEENKLAELAEKYRDRARERRDGDNPDGQAPEPAPANTASAYRAVAPDLKSGLDAKERRRQMIQESKFLGGDMEHTHLVKGLDYALLQKVRSEIHTRENEREVEMERLVSRPPEDAEDKEEEDEIQFKTKIGRDIYKTLAAYRSKQVDRNEMFTPGRMAYVMELEEDEADIPTTLVRSRAEVPALQPLHHTLTTNDMVINKLAQILAYLRQGGRHAKKPKKNKEKGGRPSKPQDDSIYGDIGDYTAARERKTFRDKDLSQEAASSKQSYFDKPLEKEKEEVSGAVRVRAATLLSRLAAEPEGYAECYPGLREMDDAIDDSDDEVDYTKMDVGNKKGPIGRWDFDTQEEYSAYMNQKEALPKAAFQYGVKTTDGRKTRKTNKERNDKAELDREWQQIQNIIQKRKGPKESHSTDEPDFKVPKY